MHEVLVNRLGGLSLPRKSVVRLTDRPDMTLDVYHGRKTTIQQQQQQPSKKSFAKQFQGQGKPCLCCEIQYMTVKNYLQKDIVDGKGSVIMP